MTIDSLRAEREKQGLTLKDIEDATSIRAVYIDAIENGRYGDLPGAVYAKGFIRNYAEFLKLDPERFLRQYREETGLEESPPAPETTSLVNERAPFSSGSDFKNRVQKSHRTQNILIAAAVVLLAFVGSVYYFFGEEDAKDETRTADISEPVGSGEKAGSLEKSAPTGTPDDRSDMMPSASAAPKKAVDISAKFTDRCWTQVTADGKKVYEGIAEAGQGMNFAGDDRVLIIAGNAGAVEVVHNGKNIGTLGKPGAVVEKRFTRDKVEDVK